MAEKIALEVGKAIGKAVLTRLRKNLPVLTKALPEKQKRCRVYGERVDKMDAMTVLGSRFLRERCGHRTHAHCGSPEPGVCLACHEGSSAVRSKKTRATKKAPKKRRA